MIKNSAIFRNEQPTGRDFRRMSALRIGTNAP